MHIVINKSLRRKLSHWLLVEGYITLCVHGNYYCIYLMLLWKHKGSSQAQQRTACFTLLYSAWIKVWPVHQRYQPTIYPPIHPFSAYPKGGGSGSRLSGIIQASFSLAALWGTSALFNTKEQQLRSSLPTDVWVPHPIFEAQPLTGKKIISDACCATLSFRSGFKAHDNGQGLVNQEIFTTCPSPAPSSRDA